MEYVNRLATMRTATLTTETARIPVIRILVRMAGDAEQEISVILSVTVKRAGVETSVQWQRF